MPNGRLTRLSPCAAVTTTLFSRPPPSPELSRDGLLQTACASGTALRSTVIVTEIRPEANKIAAEHVRLCQLRLTARGRPTGMVTINFTGACACGRRAASG